MFLNKDQIKGRAKEAKGKIKEVTGDLVGNEKLETKGKIEKNLGKAQAKACNACRPSAVKPWHATSRPTCASTPKRRSPWSPNAR